MDKYDLVIERPRFLDDIEHKMRIEKTYQDKEGLTIKITGVDDYPVSHHLS
jgi:hypothetical protein